MEEIKITWTRISEDGSNRLQRTSVTETFRSMNDTASRAKARVRYSRSSIASRPRRMALGPVSTSPAGA